MPLLQKSNGFYEKNHIKFHKFDTINNDNVLRLLTIGGVDQVPFLYNEETEDKIYESEEIIKYLENMDRNNYAKQ